MRALVHVLALAATAALGSLLLTGCPSDACSTDDDGYDVVCVDEDGDGYCGVCCDSYCGQLDCDDQNPDIAPYRTDRTLDGVDWDCDGSDLGGDGSACNSDAECTGTCNLDNGYCTSSAERCDNDVDDDQDGLTDCQDLECAAFCTQNVQLACALGIDLVTQAPGDFTAADDVVDSCGYVDRPELFFRLPVAEADGETTIRLVQGEAQTVGLRASCLEGELSCNLLSPPSPDAPPEAQLTDRFTFPVLAGERHYLVVEQGPGAFVLERTFMPAVCGDGLVTAPESCDDGATTGGDGCDAACQVEPDFDYCAAAVPLDLGTVQGSTATSTTLTSGSCGGTSAPEALHDFVAPADGVLQVVAQSTEPIALYARQSCSDAASELSCKLAAGGAAVIYVPVTGGETTTVFVDGVTPKIAFDYTLTAFFVAD
ncbi:MAG: hypothetical protein R3B72_04895 [Polyangiaceae bacterium]